MSGEKWRDLFDGETLAGWKPSMFPSQQSVKVEKPFRDRPSAIILEPGADLSGLTWGDASTVPKINYEITLEAMKLAGSDFFCGLTFPVGGMNATFVVGGWGGTVVGLSSLEEMDASENETTRELYLTPDRWYRIRLRVTAEKIEAWLDQEKVIDLKTKGRQIGLRFGDIEHSLPLGLAAFRTRAALRDIRLRQW